MSVVSFIGHCPDCGATNGPHIVDGIAWAGCIVHMVKWRVPGLTGNEETDCLVLHNLWNCAEVPMSRAWRGAAPSTAIRRRPAPKPSKRAKAFSVHAARPL